MNDLDDLAGRWARLWQTLSAREIPFDAFDELVRAYSAPERAYHNLAHVQDCLALFEQGRALALNPAAVELALWFHDVVYDPRRSDNEAASAARVQAVLEDAQLSPPIVEKVRQLILATQHTASLQDRDAQIVADIDLAILGRPAEIFWRYEANIRHEYASVPGNLYCNKRIAVLSGFLQRPHIYALALYRNPFEPQARLNLLNAIAQLEHEHQGCGSYTMKDSLLPRPNPFFDAAYQHQAPWDIGAAQPAFVSLPDEFPKTD